MRRSLVQQKFFFSWIASKQPVDVECFRSESPVQLCMRLSYSTERTGCCFETHQAVHRPYFSMGCDAALTRTSLAVHLQDQVFAHRHIAFVENRMCTLAAGHTQPVQSRFNQLQSRLQRRDKKCRMSPIMVRLWRRLRPVMIIWKQL